MEDPAPPEFEDYTVEEDEIIAEIHDIRRWRAEQRAKYGKDWEDHSPPGCSDYERSRGLVPPDKT